jgi:hypothetical protein
MGHGRCFLLLVYLVAALFVLLAPHPVSSDASELRSRYIRESRDHTEGSDAIGARAIVPPEDVELTRYARLKGHSKADIKFQKSEQERLAREQMISADGMANSHPVRCKVVVG